MFDIPKQIDGRTDLFLYEIFFLFRCIGLVDQLVICRADPEPRASVVSEVNNVLALDLLNINLGCNKYRFLSSVSPARIRIKDADLGDLVVEFVNVATRFLCEMLESVRLQIFE